LRALDRVGQSQKRRTMFDHPSIPIARGWRSKGEDAAKSGHIHSIPRSVLPDNPQLVPLVSANKIREFSSKDAKCGHVFVLRSAANSNTQSSV
jgi:hypothetical protein